MLFYVKADQEGGQNPSPQGRSAAGSGMLLKCPPEVGRARADICNHAGCSDKIPFLKVQRVTLLFCEVSKKHFQIKPCSNLI